MPVVQPLRRERQENFLGLALGGHDWLYIKSLSEKLISE
jgi:hypothetical protein